MIEAMRVKGRPSKYALSLKDNEYWTQVRRKVILRDRHCQKCGKMAFLDVHHKTYYVGGQSIVGKELEHLDCLVALCRDCHKAEHLKN
jgi:5-methylcytosine-specific restriction endonuclease McrA